jgi:diguanylate cyclase (GGDEF)-like protein
MFAGLQDGPAQPTIGSVAHRLLTTAARARARDASREAPDHYALLETRLVGRLAGFLFCSAGAIAAVLLTLDPPTGAIGGAGWVPAAIMVALAFVFGVLMIVNRRPLAPVLLFGIALSGPAMLGTLQWLSGAGSSFEQILILSVVWCGVVLPPRRLAVVVACDTVVVFLPIASGDWVTATMLPERLTTVGIMWALTVVTYVHAARNRSIRRSLGAQAAEADTLARVDALTGLGNRRALDEAIVAQVALAGRTARPLCALVGDLDGFKQINDRHGHDAGDAILRAVATTMRDVVRLPDSCFRWGGDEFVILLPETDLATAETIADRISTTIASRCTTSAGTPVTLTLGCAEHVAPQTGARLLAIADAALLAAKSAARA